MTNTKIADGTIIAADLATNSVGSSEIATNAVTSVKIANGSVTVSDLQNPLVGSLQLNGLLTVTNNIVSTQDVAAGRDVAADEQVRTGTPTSARGVGDIVATDDLLADDQVRAGGSIVAGVASTGTVGNAILDVISDSSGRVRLLGSGGSDLARLTSVGGGAGEHGGLFIYDNGGIRASLFSDTTSSAGKLQLKNSSGSTTITLDGEAGNKGFVMDHPLDSTKSIVYTSIEGPEAAAYIRGTAQLVNGQATVSLSEHFSLVVNPDTMTVQVTPLSGDSKGLAVIGKSAQGFSIVELNGGTGSYEVDYLVQGVRKGQENYQAVRDKSSFESSAPAEAPSSSEGGE